MAGACCSKGGPDAADAEGTGSVRRTGLAALLFGLVVDPVPESESHQEKTMADEDLKAELERLRKENESLKRGVAKGVSLKVSEKGGVSVYGLGRFPITLYKEQWTKLLDMADDIRAFIREHEGQLKTKT
jgi:hypothetical protein